jgi:uncharacterized protein YlxP (DUF503 family)
MGWVGEGVALHQDGSRAIGGLLSPCEKKPPVARGGVALIAGFRVATTPILNRVTTYLCVIEVRLHLNESHDLKGKRKFLHSLKAQLRQRFGASVAEVDGHDTWQRSTLVCALVGNADVGRRADELERFVVSRCPDGSGFDRDLLSLADIRG